MGIVREGGGGEGGGDGGGGGGQAASARVAWLGREGCPKQRKGLNERRDTGPGGSFTERRVLRPAEARKTILLPPQRTQQPKTETDQTAWVTVLAKDTDARPSAAERKVKMWVYTTQMT